MCERVKEFLKTVSINLSIKTVHAQIKMPLSSGGLLSSISGTLNLTSLFCERNLKSQHEIDTFSDQRPES